MSKNVKKAELNRLLKGEPKRATRGTIARIVTLAETVTQRGIADMAYYTKAKPEHEAYKGPDTRKLLEREIGPFYWTTGNWDFLNDGHDTMLFFQDEEAKTSLENAGFKVREQNTAARNAADAGEDTGDEEESEVV